ncbi:MAG: hypothetical protein ACYCYO_19485 [Bacilli bacterium]
MNTRSRRKKNQLRFTVAVRRLIAAESRKLNLSEHDYLHLLMQIAATVRGAVWPNGVKDPEMLLSIAENPFVLQIVGALAGTVWAQVKDALDAEHVSEADPAAPNTAAQSPGQSGPASSPFPQPAPGVPSGTPQAPPSSQTAPVKPRAASPLIPPPASPPVMSGDDMVTLIDPMTGQRVRVQRRYAL